MQIFWGFRPIISYLASNKLPPNTSKRVRFHKSLSTFYILYISRLMYIIWVNFLYTLRLVFSNVYTSRIISFAHQSWFYNILRLNLVTPLRLLFYRHVHQDLRPTAYSLVLLCPLRQVAYHWADWLPSRLCIYLHSALYSYINLT